jgi:hypothetical protein
MARRMGRHAGYKKSVSRTGAVIRSYIGQYTLTDVTDTSGGQRADFVSNTMRYNAAIKKNPYSRARHGFPDRQECRNQVVAFHSCPGFARVWEDLNKYGPYHIIN